MQMQSYICSLRIIVLRTVLFTEMKSAMESNRRILPIYASASATALAKLTLNEFVNAHKPIDLVGLKNPTLGFPSF